MNIYSFNTGQLGSGPILCWQSTSVNKSVLHSNTVHRLLSMTLRSRAPMKVSNVRVDYGVIEKWKSVE